MMTLLLIERAKARSEYLILNIKYKLQKKIISDVINWLRNQFYARRLASFAVMTALLPVTVAPIATSNSNSIEARSIEPVLKMDTTKSSLIVSDNQISTIVPGESLVEREVREKAEAEARARAEAEAKAKASQKRNTVSRERRVYNDPSDFGSIYARAEAAYGVDARILRAIHQAETGGSGSTGLQNRSGSGATGPMQFLPSTWRRHGVDGNSDGIADINNVEDAIFSAAAYLRACGYPDVKKALWGYNPSTSYYNKVMRLAQSYGY